MLRCSLQNAYYYLIYVFIWYLLIIKYFVVKWIPWKTRSLCLIFWMMIEIWSICDNFIVLYGSLIFSNTYFIRFLTFFLFFSQKIIDGMLEQKNKLLETGKKLQKTWGNNVTVHIILPKEKVSAVRTLRM